MTRLDKSRNDLLGFCHEAASESVRSLDLLRSIDNTLSFLNRLAAQLRADASYAEKGIAIVKALPVECDPDNTLLESIDKVQSATGDLYHELVNRRNTATGDSRLTEDDGIEDAYAEAITAAADLHNSLNSLRWAIGEHDADLSPVSKPFTNATDLIKHLSA